MTLSLCWMRRDLRLNDHAVLAEALRAEQPIQPVFVFDSDILANFPNKQDRRVSFIARALARLHGELQRHGGGVLVLYGRAEEVIPKLAGALSASQVICAEDFEPQTIARDNAVATQVPLKRVLDHLILAPDAVLKDDGVPYKVFTPYSKRWRQTLKASSFEEKTVTLQGRLADYDTICQKVAHLPAHDTRAMLEAIGYELIEEDEWRVDDVPNRLQAFIAQRLAGYREHRDLMGEEGTSKLSPYLRFGLVSIRECCRLAAQQENKGSDCWLNELIWREFYAQILYHFPESERQEFQEQYRAMAWEDNAQWLQRWKDGQTGYPVVDAAMRQLLQTGWMHNRARMIVASFLTKDLHLDWRLGEAHFAQYLMDYELASNVGGWQWAASTGTDAQPYFRVFNPELQSQRFDANGAYIRRYVPELAALSNKEIHAPHKGKDLFRPLDYPEPMVDHRQQKEKAVAMFKKVVS